MFQKDHLCKVKFNYKSSQVAEQDSMKAKTKLHKEKNSTAMRGVTLQLRTSTDSRKQMKEKIQDLLVHYLPFENYNRRK